MSFMIQIRNVPDELHRRLKARAALSGMSLSEYLLAGIRETAMLPTPDEMRGRLRSREATGVALPVAEAVRAEREAR